MSEELIVRHCSPTLAGLKTANLFVCSFDDEKEMRADIRRLNKLLTKKGIRITPLRINNKKALIYVYRPSRLSRDLGDCEACRLLRERGYDIQKPELCVSQLKKRIGESEEFPHEIGLFLGYPPEDVCGFIDNKACCSKCSGCWKVYGDEESAKKLFAKYKKCTEVYRKKHADGRPIERLTVAS